MLFGTAGVAVLSGKDAKEEAKGVIEKLHSLGIQNICMMTSDSERTAASIAAQLGISDYGAEVLPE